MRRLIVNADDFGLSRGVNEGIIEAYRKGIVRSATILANSTQFDDAVAKAKQNSELGIGCHLSLIGGPSLAARDKVPNLADENEFLPGSWPQLLAKLSRGLPHSEMVLEFRAQLDRVARSGVPITHVDSHKHIHVVPRILKAAVEAASECGIRRIRNPFDSLRPAYLASGGRRWTEPSCLIQFTGSLGVRVFSSVFRDALTRAKMRTPDHFFGVVFTGRLNPDLVVSLLRSLPEGVSELMCHPGHFDEELRRQDTRLCEARELELQAVTDPKVLTALRESPVELIDYSALQNES